MFRKRRNYFAVSPLGTDCILHIDEIHVPKRFIASPPKQWKYELYKNNIIQMKRLDIPVIVHIVRNNEFPNGAFYITDGYIRYLVAKEIGIEYIPCKIV